MNRAHLLKTGQYGRLYIVSFRSMSGGTTFRIFVLPEGEAASVNGPASAPLNSDAVEVYDESGWLHDGPWRDDFEELLLEKLRKQAADAARQDAAKKAETDAKAKRVQELLATYTSRSQRESTVQGQKLGAEQNTPGVRMRVYKAAAKADLTGARIKVVFQLGHWWVISSCGGHWRVTGATGPGTVDGFDFKCVR